MVKSATFSKLSDLNQKHFFSWLSQDDQGACSFQLKIFDGDHAWQNDNVLRPESTTLASWLDVMKTALSGQDHDRFEFKLDNQATLKAPVG
ncbi:hypothetical protein WJX74_006543 [Apatococcus lobatus]|uniref:Uncharacterized protein n=1 Tax=Apatococcus lobatus TaxID=904363 RepID=A0AAW1S6M1_9CHLO